jgi:hypothetical protein
MKKIIILLLFLSLIFPASASTVSLSDLHMVSFQKYDLYKVNQSSIEYVGEINSTDQIYIDSDYDYQLVLKPDRMDWLASIPTTLSYLTSTDGGRVLGMLIIIIVFGGGFLTFFRTAWR